jgi:hypothetical protein
LLSGLRLVCLSAAVLLLVGLPIADATVLLSLVLALDIAVAALALRKPAPASPSSTVVPVGFEPGSDPASLHLLRRTVPELRGRRPPAVIAAQVRWRRAAETRRSRDAVS